MPGPSGRPPDREHWGGLAAEQYGLVLSPATHRAHDAEALDGRMVQIKLTQRLGVGLSSCPEHLLVQKLHPDGQHEEIYNGPSEPIWEWCAPRVQKNGQAMVSLSRLQKLMADMPQPVRLTAIE